MADDPVALFEAGRISAEVALARLVLAGVPPRGIGGLLPAASRIATTYRDHLSQLDAVAAMLSQSGAEHAEGAGPAEIGAMFDRAVRVAPEASVAAWSLNDPAVLAAGTAELVAWLRAGPWFDSDADVLDLGCGIGRVAAALAPHVHSVLGVDVSGAMVAEARRRHGARPGLRFDITNGAPPFDLPAAGFDLVLAVDSFPYVVQAGLGAVMVGEAVRLLRPEMHLVVLNLSYRADEAADGLDARDWAERFGLTLVVCGARPFQLWDGAAFVWRVNSAAR